jgi:hypothetical protein
MTQNTSDEARILAQFQEALHDNIPLNVKWCNRITRANGTIEELIIPHNIVTKDGLNAMAARAIGVATSAIAYLAIGTVTAAHSLGSVVTGFGEISRKTPSILATSMEVVIVTMTWAGNADGLTGVALGSAACVNHASSGLGIAYNLTNSVNATLAASDFLLLQAEIQIGSHNL